MTEWFSIALSFLSNNPHAVWMAASAILVGAALGYWGWFRPEARRLQLSLVGLAKALEGNADGWAAVKDRARSAARGHAAVKMAWQETEDRVIPLPHGQRSVFVMFGAPRDLWSASRLLSRSMNRPLADAIPNLLVGVGLLFTFFFLTLALTQATAALLPQSGQSPTDLTSATRGLLSAAGAKFSTSLAGLLASIVWAFGARRRMAELDGVAEDVVERLGRVVSPGGGEMAMFVQLQVAREHLQSNALQVDVTKDLVKKADEQKEISEELLGEARDQTGTFKRFETDLAVSLASAITNAFSPEMERMTGRLTAAIEGLSNKMGTMNQEALQRMLEDFAGLLRSETDSEMTQLRETLEMLATRLTGAGTAIDNGASKAADKLDKAGTDLLARVEQVATSLTTGATNLEDATQGVKEAMNDLDVSITQAADLGKQGATFVRGALETSGEVFGQLKAASEELNAAGVSLGRVTGQLSHAIDSVEEMTQEQRAVVSAVREATPEAMASVQRVLDLLQQTVQVTATMMAQTKDSMTATSRTLGTTVAEITAGISEYSNKVAELHRTMDEQLARAIGSLDKGVTGLEEAVEELGEVISSRMPKG